MYARPPFVANASVAIPGAGTSTVTIVAAPGAGFVIRLLGGQICINRAAGANGDLEIRMSGTTVVRAFGLQAAGTSAMPFDIPEPGILGNVNTLLQGAVTSTAAAGNATFTVYYAIDPV